MEGSVMRSLRKGNGKCKDMEVESDILYCIPDRDRKREGQANTKHEVAKVRSGMLQESMEHHK